MNKSNTISIYLTDEEQEKAEEARNYGVLNQTGFFKILIKNGLDEMEKSKELVFHFDRSKKYGKSAKRMKVIRLEKSLYLEMEKICEATPFSMSSLAKYLIMPQVDEIIQRKELNYKP